MDDATYGTPNRKSGRRCKDATAIILGCEWGPLEEGRVVVPFNKIIRCKEAMRNFSLEGISARNFQVTCRL